ncbi:MAG: hypothetical protein C5B49_11230 [Bdellovibrio sp.]|nr:MAG: hypothetical protein C5B49_11230 [Bdellovibrio sp.]
MKQTEATQFYQGQDDRDDQIDRGDRGQSILEIAAAIGIFSILILSILASLSYFQQQAAMQEESLAVADFQQQLSHTFADGTICTQLLTQPSPATFDSSNATTGNPLAPVIVISNGTISVSTKPSAPALATPGQSISTILPKLKIAATNPFTVRNIVGSSSGSLGVFVANLAVAFDPTTSRLPLTPATTQIVLKTSASGTSQTVTGCLELGGWSAINTTFAVITNYHNACTGADPSTFPAASAGFKIFNCNSACQRYCSNGCAPSVVNCNGYFPGLGFSGGAISEYDSTAGTATCLCIR